MVKSEKNKIKTVLDRINLDETSLVNDLSIEDENLKKRYKYLSKELGISETLLYKEALKLFINLESEWLGKNN